MLPWAFSAFLFSLLTFSHFQAVNQSPYPTLVHFVPVKLPLLSEIQGLTHDLSVSQSELFFHPAMVEGLKAEQEAQAGLSEVTLDLLPHSLNG